jgi:hypothetical protein
MIFKADSGVELSDNFRITCWMLETRHPGTRQDNNRRRRNRRSIMARKDRSDQTVGSHEKKHGLPPGTVRNPDGRDTRSDKEIGTIRKEGEKKK